MKTTHLFFLFFIASFTSHLSAQEFAPLGTSWHFAETYFTSPNIGVVTFSNVRDTTINGKALRAIYKDNATCNGNVGDHYFHQNQDSVFSYTPDTDVLNLLFILNAEVGDSWTINAPFSNDSDSLICQVDSISFFNVSPTDSIRIQHVSLAHSFFPEYPFPDEIVGAAGFRSALVPTSNIYSLCDGDYESGLRCYETPQTGLINFTDVGCLDTPTETVLDATQVVVFPNPASDQLTIENKKLDLIKAEIYDLQARKLKTIEGHFESIDVSDLPKGIFLLKLYAQEGVLTKRIVVQ